MVAKIEWQDRTLRLLGPNALENLSKAHVLVVGLGGVGGYAVEMLARTGVGRLTLVDADAVAESNINRQIIALNSTIGRKKTELWEARVAEINADARVRVLTQMVTPENVSQLFDDNYDYVIDCIDTVAPKVALLIECMKRKEPVISSMGAGGRMDPTKVSYMDLWETRDDGLARAVRERMKKMGMKRKLQVVASTERPSTSSIIQEDKDFKRTSFGTIAALPAVFGILLANKVILKLAGQTASKK